MADFDWDKPATDEFAWDTAPEWDTPVKQSKAELAKQYMDSAKQGSMDWSNNLTGVAESGLSLATGAGSMLTGLVPAAMQKLNDSSVDFEKQYAANIDRTTYEPREQLGKDLVEKSGKFINDTLVPGVMGAQGLPYVNTAAVPLRAGLSALGKNLRKAGEKAPSKVESAIAELNSKEESKVDPNLEFYKQEAERKRQEALGIIQVDPNGIARTAEQERSQPRVEEKATNGPDGQMALFDIPENLRQPTKYEAVPGDWRVDENGIPIKADLSMEAQNLQEPLQRNLWGDELAPKHEQEAPRGLTDAIDSMDWAHKRGALKKTLLGHDLEAPGTLEAAKMAAENQANRNPHGSPLIEMNSGIKVSREAIEKLRFLRDEIPVTTDKGYKLSIGEAGPVKRNEANQWLVDNTHTPTEGDRSLVAKDIHGRVVAYVDLSHVEGNTFTPKDVKVSAEAQRKGIATALYNEAERRGWTIKESPYKTDAGSAFRKGFNAKQGQVTELNSGLKPSWGQKDTIEPLKAIPGIGNRLREVGHAMIQSPEEAIKLAKERPDVSQGLIDKTLSLNNMMTKGGTYLKAKVNNPVVHYVVDKFLGAENRGKAEIADKVHQTYLPTLRDLSGKERTEVFTLLNAADLNKKTITPELMNKWGLSDKQKAFITLHNERMADVLGKINSAREAVGKKPIEAREAYSAMNMTGDYRKVVKVGEQVVGVIGSNSMTFGKNSLKNLEKNLKEKNPTYEFGPLVKANETTRTKGSPHEAFMDVLKTLGEDNPHMKEFLNTLAEVAKDDASNYMGMQKHTLTKKGVFGMEGRKEWLSPEENAKQFFENQVRYMENAYNWAHITEAAKDVNKVLRDKDVIDKQPKAIKMGEDYMANAIGLNTSKVGKAMNTLIHTPLELLGYGPSVGREGVSLARKTANTMVLSLNPFFLAINIMQPMAAMPGLSSMLRSVGGSKSLTFGIGDMTKAAWTLTKPKSMLSGLEKGALDYAKDNHIYSTDMVEHANQVEKGTRYYGTKVLQGPAAMVEQATRAQMYMGLVHMLDSAGITPKAGLYEQAHRFTDMAMNNYAAIEKPPIYNALGDAGSMAYNLKSYGHNEISRWALYARELGEHGNAKPILTQMATTIALAGVMGLPFFSQWDDLYSYITKKLGSPRSLSLDTIAMSEKVGKHLGPKGAYALSNGLFSIAGADMSKRVGLGDVVPSHVSDAAFAGAGKLGSAVKAGVGAVMDPSNPDKWKALGYNVAPQVAQGPMDVSMYQKNGLAYSKDPENIHPVAKRNDTDILMKKIGLTGINESVQKTKNYENSQITKAIMEYRTQGLHQIAQDLFNNRPINPKAIERYFKNGQGDGKSFEMDLQNLAQKQNMDPRTYQVIRDAASQRIPQVRELQRITQ
jgi:hypothetical protein